MSTTMQIAALVGMMVNAVLFGAGAVVVLSIPALAAHAAVLLPAVVVVSLLAAPPIARAIAPRMRLRNRRVAAH
jgi:hypothetical protein